MNSSDTRPSLLISIRDPQNREAWNEFTNIYRPAIIRLAKTKGLQHADAEDLAQQVLVSVSKAIQKWEPDSTRARFRTWLTQVTHNAALNAITRVAPNRGTGNSNLASLLEAIPSQEPESRLLTLEIRREAFRYASHQIRAEFQQETWQAFWDTAVLGRAINEVASQLNKNPGSVYAARSRVMRRLREKIIELQLPDSQTEIPHASEKDV